jgi:diguanylate cyclase (GGDEF)-like protein
LATHLAIAIQQSELYQQVQRLASSDSLTQIANRRRFDEYLDQEWQRMAREGAPLSLILCDIDFFKTYNDTYGHQAGDNCLQQVAQAISFAVKRPADLVARYGGEEFAVILPHTDAQGSAQIAEKIRSQVQVLQIAHAGSQVSQYITLSLGVASTVPAYESSPAVLIAAADKSLYQAKAEGRDRVVLQKQGGVVE